MIHKQYPLKFLSTIQSYLPERNLKPSINLQNGRHEPYETNGGRGYCDTELAKARSAPYKGAASKGHWTFYVPEVHS
jgi:hypothetical protein